MIEQVVILSEDGELRMELHQGDLDEVVEDQYGKAEIVEVLPLGELAKLPGLLLAEQIDTAFDGADAIMLRSLEILIDFAFQQGRKIARRPELGGM